MLSKLSYVFILTLISAQGAMADIDFERDFKDEVRGKHYLSAVGQLGVHGLMGGVGCAVTTAGTAIAGVLETIPITEVALMGALGFGGHGEYTFSEVGAAVFGGAFSTAADVVIMAGKAANNDKCVQAR